VLQCGKKTPPRQIKQIARKEEVPLSNSCHELKQIAIPIHLTIPKSYHIDGHQMLLGVSGAGVSSLGAPCSTDGSSAAS
jgi:hypothetical protein